MIDIIIPAYNAHKTIEQTLISLSFQTIKDKLNVIIVDDNSDMGYDDIVNKFKKLLNIKIYKNNTNMGAGYSRQKGLEKSNSKYIMFIDSDDLLYSFNSIEKIYGIIIKGYDYLDSYSINECNNNRYINEGDLHGKIYLREFLEKNKICFNNSRYHEDNAFNSIVLLNEPKRARFNGITYLYCDNIDSLTKKERENEFYRLKIYIENMRYVLNETSKCNNNLVEKYVDTKYNYLFNYCNSLEKEKKELINNWLQENEFEKLF